MLIGCDVCVCMVVVLQPTKTVCVRWCQCVIARPEESPKAVLVVVCVCVVCACVSTKSGKKEKKVGKGERAQGAFCQHKKLCTKVSHKQQQRARPCSQERKQNTKRRRKERGEVKIVPAAAGGGGCSPCRGIQNMELIYNKCTGTL